MELLIAFSGFFGLLMGGLIGADFAKREREDLATRAASISRLHDELAEIRRQYECKLAIEYGRGWKEQHDFLSYRILSALSLPAGAPEQKNPNS